MITWPWDDQVEHLEIGGRVNVDPKSYCTLVNKIFRDIICLGFNVILIWVMVKSQLADTSGPSHFPGIFLRKVPTFVEVVRVARPFLCLAVHRNSSDVLFVDRSGAEQFEKMC